MTPKSELASNITPAAIFRYIEQERPTLIIDEADTFVNANEFRAAALALMKNHEMRGILNSGHTRASAFVIRVVEFAGEHVAKRFSTWAAKAIAGIGSLADTISDRSIILVMQRKTRDQKVNRLRRRDSPELGEIRRKALRWTQDNQAALAEADERTEVPAEPHDRAADNWRRLLTIAGQCAGCEQPINGSAAINLPDGNRVHLEPLDWLLSFGKRWRGEADDALAALLVEPTARASGSAHQSWK